MARTSDSAYISERVIVDKATGCWNWTGPRDRDGYGTCSNVRPQSRAHRLSFLANKGEIPAGAMVLHSCDNPPCCNPDHLSLGDAHSNAHDAMAKGRNSRGSRNGFSKLTEAQVADIRARHTAGERHKALAEDYGVSVACIDTLCCVTAGWKHVAPAAPRVRHHLSTITHADRENFRADRVAGMKYRDLAAKYGLTYGAVKRWCLVHGLGGPSRKAVL